MTTWDTAATHQSVSSTAAVWPRNKGIWSGSFPRSFRGMTANAPPPPDSQLTERYSGLTWARSEGSAAGLGCDEAGYRAKYLHQVGIPGIAADVEVVVAELLLGRLPKDVSCENIGQHKSHALPLCAPQRSTRADWELGSPTIFRRAHKSASHRIGNLGTKATKGWVGWKGRLEQLLALQLQQV